MKKLLASLMAMTLAFAFTACSLAGDDDDESSSKKSKKDTSSSVVESDSEEESKDEASSEEEASSSEEKDDSSEAEGSSEADASSDESSETEKPAANGNFTGNGYTLDIDSAKWTDISSSIAGVDCAFSYAGDASLASANFNIIAQSGAGGISISDAVELIQQQYVAQGYTVSKDELTKFNGYDAYIATMEIEQDGMKLKMNQVAMIENDTLYLISYGSDSSVFDSVEPEFNTVLATFAIS